MDVRSALVAHPQSAELPEPGQSPLNDPPVRAQPATMPCAPAGYHRRDVAQTQGLPVRPRVIGTVRIQPFGSAARTTAFAPDRVRGALEPCHLWPPVNRIYGSRKVVAQHRHAQQ